MPLPYRILFYLENDSTILIELKRLDLPDEPAPDQLFHWLLFDKATQQLQKLNFVSMNSQPGVEERAFRQGTLRFTPEAGTYTAHATGQPVPLQVSSVTVLPDALSQAVAAYLRAQ